MALVEVRPTPVNPYAVQWRQAVATRFWTKVACSAPEDCWAWVGQIDSMGYGQFRMGKRHVRAQRVAYELTVGPILDGLTIDHLCHNRDESCLGGSSCLHRRCCNPAHLEAVTRGKNVLRGVGPTAINARKTHCKHGHEFTEENTYSSSKGRRVCKECTRVRVGRGYWLKKGDVSGRTSQRAGHGWNSTKTHCPQGHPYDEANTYITPGGVRSCRICHRERERIRKARLKGVRSA